MKEKPRTFLKTFRLIQIAIFALPIGAKAINLRSAFVFPPLGTLGAYTVFITCGVVGLAALLPTTIHGVKALRFSFFTALVIVCICTPVYFVLIGRYVVRIDAPSQNWTTFISIGSERTQFARENFPNSTDQEMMEARGPTEDEVNKLWVPESVTNVRLGLLGFYTIVLGALNFGIGCLARLEEEKNVRITQ